MSSAPSASLALAWATVANVPDPEIPVLSVVDLGLVRRLEVFDNGAVRLGVAPTYSGCPATAVIRRSLVEALQAAGFRDVVAHDELSPPWTSDWITDEGREKLRSYGIAPPGRSAASPRALAATALAIACPRCGSEATEQLSEFGSTPCKALHRCTACLEPFDYFKCL
jgi:ring-1,2-phenylacetyl-CoA epoxidase subunit PaaD